MRVEGLGFRVYIRVWGLGLGFRLDVFYAKRTLHCQGQDPQDGYGQCGVFAVMRSKVYSKPLTCYQ